MAVIPLKVFSGEVPQKPPHLLEDDNAQQAVNCDFSHGNLRPLAAGFFLKSMANTVRGIYTEDGLNFFTWPIDTLAYKGPVVDDTFRRVYFCNANGLFVTQSDQMRLNGGEPTTAYKVGVPPLTVAPTVKLSNRTSLPDYPGATIKLRFFRDYQGKRYDEQDISATSSTEYYEYTFTEPAASSSTGSAQSVSKRTVYAGAVGKISTGDVLASPMSSILIASATKCTIVATSVVVDGGADELFYTNADGVAVTFSELLATVGSAASTPESASPAVQVTLYDPTSKQDIFVVCSSNASSGSIHSDAIPGGVEAILSKVDGTTNQWKVKLDYGIYETRAYVVTLVNAWNEESQNSDPTTVNVTYMQQATISFPWLVTQTYGLMVPNRYRIYRSTAGTSPTYLSCTTAPQTLNPVNGTVTFVDTLITVKETDAVLKSQDWYMPPDGLRNLTAMPNGFFMASKGNTVYLSEPYRPWAWPYSMTFPSSVVGIVATEQTAVITTTSAPFVVNGVNPDGMAQSRLPIQQAGVSQYTTATLEGQVVFASHDGIVAVAGLNASLNSSQQLFRRDNWRDRYDVVLPYMKWAVYDGALVGFSTTTQDSFVIRMDENIGDYTQLRLQVDSAFYLPQSDQLYYSQGNSLYQYRGGAAMTYDWWSKDFIVPKPLNFGAVYARVDEMTSLSVYIDGVFWCTIPLPATGYYRLPSGKKGRRWSFRLQGKGNVNELHVAETLKELANV